MPALRPESVIMGRDPEVLSNLLHFYACEKARVLDCTANTRKMWNGVAWEGEVVYADIDPGVHPDVVSDFRAMTFAASSFDVIVFDPPHLPAAAASPESHPQMVRDYGLASIKGQSLAALSGEQGGEDVRALPPGPG